MCGADFQVAAPCLALPPQRNKRIPFYVELDECKFLEYSTAELLDRRKFGDGVQLILHADADETVETRLVLPEKQEVKKWGDAMSVWESPNTLMLVGVPGQNLQVSIVDNLRVVLMERGLAGLVWDVAHADGTVVAASDMALLDSACANNKTRVRVQIVEEDVFLHILTPSQPLLKSPTLDLSGSYDEEFGVYSANGLAKLPDVDVELRDCQSYNTSGQNVDLWHS